MFANIFTKINHNKVCFVFNDLFKEKKNNNLNEHSRVKQFLKKNHSKYSDIKKLSNEYKNTKFKVLISAGDIPISKLTLKGLIKFFIKIVIGRKDAEIFDQKFIEKEMSINSIKFPNNLDRNLKHYPRFEWGKVFDIFFISLNVEKKLIYNKFKKKKVINIGFPRLDQKFNIKKIKKKIISEFNLDLSKKIIIYLPTLSLQNKNLVFKYVAELENLSNLFNVIVRPHPKDQDLHREKFQIFKKSKLKLDLKNGRNTSDLMLSSDLIISDGGSSIIEAVYLKKKIMIHNWLNLVNPESLEKRFTESSRLDKIISRKLFNLSNLEKLNKIKKSSLGKSYQKKIDRLNKKFIYSSQKKNVIKIINSIYDN